MKSFNIFWGALTVLLLLSSCNKENQRPLTALEKQGKASYMSNCIACHNPDPRLAGSIGPDVAYSSLELLTARIKYKSYPPGYKPKRETAIMPDLSILEKDIPAIHAYLNSFPR
jgi:mono/diheme cytochrome c family protein